MEFNRMKLSCFSIAFFILLLISCISAQNSTDDTNNASITSASSVIENTSAVPTLSSEQNVVTQLYEATTSDPSAVSVLEQPLYLTPLIEAGDFTKALSLSAVNYNGLSATSYAGLITINAELNSNMFFWFFPATQKDTSVPLLIWLSGCPGTSSVEGVFGQSGPFMVGSNLSLEARSDQWTASYNILYIDAPLGSGFSYTESETEYATDSNQVAIQIYKCLLQFFTLFKQYQSNDVYIVGTSYSGKFAETLGYYIHFENDFSPLRSNLKGIILLSGLIEPFLDLTPANYLYQIGLVNQKQLLYFKDLADLSVEFIQSSGYGQAADVLQKQNVEYESITGMSSDLDILTGLSEPTIYEYARKLVNETLLRNALHVGNLTLYGPTGPGSTYLMLQDQFTSYTRWLEFLLNTTYKVLIVGGQFDAKYNPAVTDQTISNFNWKWTKDYFGSERTIMKDDQNEISGYVTTLQNLCYVVLRMASHYVTSDQPVAVLKAVQNFIQN